MKKRILSLALALVMLFSLVLASCGKKDDDDDEPVVPAPVEPTVEKLFDKLVAEDKKVGNSTFLKTDIGEIDENSSVFPLGEHFFVYEVEEWSEEDVANGIPSKHLSTTYTFINKYNSTKFSYTVDEDIDDKDEKYNSTITGVFGFEHPQYSDFIQISICYGNPEDGGKGVVALYNKFGDKVAETAQIANVDKYEDVFFNNDTELNNTFVSRDLPLISFAGFVYFIEDDCKLTQVLDPYKNSLNFDNIDYNEYTKEFCSEEEDSNGIINYTILDKTLKVVKSIKFERNTNATYYAIVYLNNYNLILTELYTLTDDATEWDIYYNINNSSTYNNKTKVVSYLINAETNEKTLLDIDFVPENNMSFYYNYSETCSLKEDINILSYYKIDNKKLVNASNYVVVDNDGKVVKYLDPFYNSSSYTVTQNGMKILSTSFGDYYLNNNGEIIRSVFNGSVEYNNIWAIVTNADSVKIYDADCKLVYELPEGCEIESIFNNSIEIKKEIREDITEMQGDVSVVIQENALVGYEYCLFTGSSSLTTIYSSRFVAPTEGTVAAQYMTSDSYYALTITDVVTGDVSIKLYDDLGKEIVTLDKDCQIIGMYSNELADTILVQKTVVVEGVDELNNPIIVSTTVTNHVYSILMPQ